jgi:hypothetical protein
MIARIWHGYTKPEDADAYEAMLKPELLPDISRANGYRGVTCSEESLGSKSSSPPMIWESEPITTLFLHFRSSC